MKKIIGWKNLINKTWSSKIYGETTLLKSTWRFQLTISNSSILEEIRTHFFKKNWKPDLLSSIYVKWGLYDRVIHRIFLITASEQWFETILI